MLPQKQTKNLEASAFIYLLILNKFLITFCNYSWIISQGWPAFSKQVKYFCVLSLVYFQEQVFHFIHYFKFHLLLDSKLQKEILGKYTVQTKSVILQWIRSQIVIVTHTAQYYHISFTILEEIRNLLKYGLVFSLCNLCV